MQATQPRVAWWRVLSWQMYDFAETMYSMNVYTRYFGLFILAAFARSATEFGTILTVANLLVAITSPLLGAMSDVSQRRLPFLRFFAVGTAISTAMIGFSDSYWMALTWFVLSFICNSSAWNFYQALLPGLCDETNVSRVSGGGIALGYVGSITGLVIMLFVVGDDTSNYNLVFPITAALYMLICLPALFLVPDFAPASRPIRFELGSAYRRVTDTLTHARKYPGLFRFLVADFIYENAVSAVIGFMSVYAAAVVGFEEGDLTVFFIFSTGAAVVFGFLFGPIVDRIGPKRAVLITLALWFVIFPAVSLATTPFHLRLVGPFAGIGLAAVWISSRTYLVALAPVQQSGEFFGLYSLSGKSAGVLGTAVWTLTMWLLKDRVGEPASMRAAVWVMWVFIVIGIVMVRGLPDVRPTKANILDRSTADS